MGVFSQNMEDQKIQGIPLNWYFEMHVFKLVKNSQAHDLLLNVPEFVLLNLNVEFVWEE
jgi:hypothetical protein